jgi:hypothetical protein
VPDRSQIARRTGVGIRAAEYVRTSTEHQKYSTENQADAIREYAARRGIEIVRTYADQGKSGLSLDGRDALKRLIDDVQNGRADFGAVPAGQRNYPTLAAGLLKAPRNHSADVDAGTIPRPRRRGAGELQDQRFRREHTY